MSKIPDKDIKKEDFVSYCNIPGIGKFDVMEKFNLTYTQVGKYLKYFNIKLGWKSKNKQLIEKISYEDFYNYYIKENHTINECMKYYDLCESNIIHLIKFYKIKKDRKNSSKLIAKTKLEKYGSLGYNNREKAKSTILNKYGVENCAQIPESKEKRKSTIISKYGDLETFYSVRDDKIKSKFQQLYGVDYASQIKNWNETLNKNMASKYGSIENFYSYRGHKALKEKLNAEFESLYWDKEKSLNYFNSLDKNLNCYELSEIFKVKINYIYQWIEKYNLQSYVNLKPSFRSSYEDEILKLFENFKVETNTRNIFDDHKELDIYLPDLNLGIEFNGTYWHSSLFLNKRYHFEKSKMAQEKGIRLIHIYEYEWNDPLQKEKIISMLKIASNQVESKIYARNCEIREITNKEAKPFNELNHLQGHRNAQITYGLFYKNELVQLMSFSKHSKYEWEIIRGCPASNNIVIGGVSKLFKHFIREYNPNQVFSYCDFNKFDGKGYEAIGMEFIGYTGPDMKWIMKDGVYNRQPKKHKEMKEKSLAQIFGSGSKKYLYTRNN